MESNTQEKKDIFDKIMSVKPFNFFEPFYKKHKEVLMYLFFGGLTTLLNIVVGVIIEKQFTAMGMAKSSVATWSTVISWIAGVLFAYVTNRIWVFNSKAKGAEEILKEMGSFFGGRLFTFFVEWVIMQIFYTKMGLPYIGPKVVANVIVVILNYVISKLIVFRKKPEEKVNRQAE